MNTLDYWCIILSKAGYGSVNLLKSYNCDIFLNILDYETFISEYSREMIALNKVNR